MHLLKYVIDNMNSITKDPKVSLADRINSERVKLQALALLQHAVVASISSPDPSIALKKMIEQSSRRQQC
jgi:hypothetical protein